MREEIVLSAPQLLCLVSPACNEVMTCLRTLGEASAADVAAQMDRSPATAHYHLKALEKAGLAHVVGRRASGRRPIAVYQLTAVRFHLPSPEKEPCVQALSTKAVLAGARQAMRGYAAAATAGHKAHALRGQMRLSPADARRFFELLEDLSRFAQEHDVADGMLLHWSSLTYEA